LIIVVYIINKSWNSSSASSPDEKCGRFTFDLFPIMFLVNMNSLSLYFQDYSMVGGRETPIAFEWRGIYLLKDVLV